MTQINKKERFSNFELLRLFAMFLVLIVHADFLSLGIPTQEDVLSAPMNAFVRFFIESLSVVCVDIFVLISGWFGIRASKKGFCKFAFQCLFFYVGIYAMVCLLGLEPLSLHGIAGVLKFNWFIIAYLGLYVLSPVLNAFVETASKNTFRNVLICFFILQTLYGWVSTSMNIFQNGYTTLSFIGLYLLARYTNVHKPSWTFTPQSLSCNILLDDNYHSEHQLRFCETWNK